MPIARTHATLLGLLSSKDSDHPATNFLKEFLTFGYKEAISCIFPVFIFLVLAATQLFSIPGIPRYDVILVACIAMQLVMYFTGMESAKELLLICFFHFLGVSMEIFKVSHGAWAYPEFAYSKVLGVPLYSGFMYASVASYICQAWKHFDLKVTDWPTTSQSTSLATAIYGNFYSNAYIQDARLLIIPILVYMFRHTWVRYTTNGQNRRMPMVLSFILIAFFIWIAENVATFLGAWKYPHQGQDWSMVRLNIMSSWFLLVIVSIIIVALFKSKEGNQTAHSRHDSA